MPGFKPFTGVWKKADLLLSTAGHLKVKKGLSLILSQFISPIPQVFPYFRSWDLFGGFPASLAAIEMIKQYCAEQIGVENGEIIASSKGLHIYDYVFEIAEATRGRSMDEFREMS